MRTANGKLLTTSPRILNDAILYDQQDYASHILLYLALDPALPCGSTNSSSSKKGEASLLRIFNQEQLALSIRQFCDATLTDDNIASIYNRMKDMLEKQFAVSCVTFNYAHMCMLRAAKPVTRH